MFNAVYCQHGACGVLAVLLRLQCSRPVRIDAILHHCTRHSLLSTMSSQFEAPACQRSRPRFANCIVGFVFSSLILKLRRLAAPFLKAVALTALWRIPPSILLRSSSSHTVKSCDPPTAAIQIKVLCDAVAKPTEPTSVAGFEAPASSTEIPLQPRTL